MSNTDIFEIKDKKVYNINTPIGLALNIIYKFTISGFQLVRVGIFFKAQKNIVIVETHAIDKSDNILDDFKMMISIDDIEKYIKTKLWCINDFKKSHPEFKKYIVH